jgi:hypothetical protein
MKTFKIPLFAFLAISVFVMWAFAFRKTVPKREKIAFVPPKGCVFRTVMGEESSDGYSKYKTPEAVMASVNKALTWVAAAQNENGGWGAGSHARQDVVNPHAVQTDPATTAMVGMALLRSGHTLTAGEYSGNLLRALEYLLQAVEGSASTSTNITALTGTQIQTKLGANIDVVLTSQFLSNVLDADMNDAMRERIKKAQNICVAKIQGSAEQ